MSLGLSFQCAAKPEASLEADFPTAGNGRSQQRNIFPEISSFS